MKLSANDALVSAVTNLGENHGEDIIPATAITLKFDLLPRHLTQFHRKLPALMFEDDVPTIPDLGEAKWKPEYENATFYLSSPSMEPLTFTDADVKGLAFEAKAGFMVSARCTVKVYANDEQRGVLAGLVKRKVTFTLEKMTQKTIEEDEEEAEDKQPDLPGTDVTTDSQPIRPLIVDEQFAEVGAETKH